MKLKELVDAIYAQGLDMKEIEIVVGAGPEEGTFHLYKLAMGVMHLRGQPVIVLYPTGPRFQRP